MPRPAGLISGSFFNPNHAAAFLTLCALAGVGVAITVTNKQRRVLAVLATVWVGAGVFLTLSRGGIFALGLGLGTLGLLLLRRTGARRSRAATAAAATAGLMIIFAALLAYERVLAEFFPNADGRIDLTKLALWPPAMRMIADNPWVGIGRGAFVSAFPRYLSEPLFARELTFSHVENQYLQLPAEWGLLVATVAIVGGLVALVGWLREQRETAICAAGAALIAIAAHNLVDFNLEMSAIALPVAILAGLLSSARRVKVKRRRGRVPALVLLSATVVAAALATVGAIAPHRSTADELTEAIAAIERGAPLSRARALIEPVIRRHPADYYPHLLLGRAAASQGSPAALAALDRALQLDPAGASVHAEAALTLQRFGRTGQALVELRLALQNHAPAAPLIARAVAMARGADDLALLLPELPELHAQAIGDLLRLGRTELAVRTARRAWRRWPGRAELLEPTTRALLAAGQTSDALETAKRWTEKQPRPRAFRLWAEAAARAGDRRRGIAILERGRRRFPADSSLALALGAALVADGSLARASALAERLTRELADPRQLAQAFALLARVHRAADRPHEAQAADQEARRLRALP